MLAKIFANGLVILVGGRVSLRLVVQGGSACPSPDRSCCSSRRRRFSVFTVAALGILLGTLASQWASSVCSRFPC